MSTTKPTYHRETLMAVAERLKALADPKRSRYSGVCDAIIEVYRMLDVWGEDE